MDAPIPRSSETSPLLSTAVGVSDATVQGRSSLPDKGKRASSLDQQVHADRLDPNQTLVDHETLAPFGHEHYSHRAPWLRAAVLGANDGLVSTSGLMMGIVAAAEFDFRSMILTGVAGVVAGSCSMALGEYVSVHSQKDAEESDVRREREEFLKGPLHAARELEELAGIYEARGLSPELSRRIAEELHASGDLDRIVKFHIRDELAIDTEELSNPLQAGIASALSFAAGGALPILTALIFAQDAKGTEGERRCITLIAVTASLGLILFGLVGAVLGGATKWKAALRVLVGGWLAMIVTYAVGRAFEATGV